MKPCSGQLDTTVDTMRHKNTITDGVAPQCTQAILYWILLKKLVLLEHLAVLINHYVEGTRGFQFATKNMAMTRLVIKFAWIQWSVCTDEA